MRNALIHSATISSHSPNFSPSRAPLQAVDVRAADFDHVEYHVTINPDERTLMKVSVKVPAFDEVKAAVGDAYFSDLYGGMLAPAAEQGFSLTLNVDLAACATLDAAGKDALVRKLQCMARDVLGAPLWECLRCLEKEMPPPKPSYTIPYRGNENMYIVPSSDLCVVVYSFAFENAVEQARARAPAARRTDASIVARWASSGMRTGSTTRSRFCGVVVSRSP